MSVPWSVVHQVLIKGSLLNCSCTERVPCLIFLLEVGEAIPKFCDAGWFAVLARAGGVEQDGRRGNYASNDEESRLRHQTRQTQYILNVLLELKGSATVALHTPIGSSTLCSPWWPWPWSEAYDLDVFGAAGRVRRAIKAARCLSADIVGNGRGSETAN
jgi:hypothetical protein